VPVRFGFVGLAPAFYELLNRLGEAGSISYSPCLEICSSTKIYNEKKLRESSPLSSFYLDVKSVFPASVLKEYIMSRATQSRRASWCTFNFLNIFILPSKRRAAIGVYIARFPLSLCSHAGFFWRHAFPRRV
jgi:hypothetical protein